MGWAARQKALKREQSQATESAPESQLQNVGEQESPEPRQVVITGRGGAIAAMMALASMGGRPDPLPLVAPRFAQPRSGKRRK